MTKKTYAYIALGILIGGSAIWAIAHPKEVPQPTETTQAPTVEQTATTAPEAAGKIGEEVKIVATSTPEPPKPQKQAAGQELTKQNILIRINNARIDAGLQPLREVAALDASATLKVNDEVKGAYFAHTSPTGIAYFNFITQAGYSYTRAGENLAEVELDPPAGESVWTAEDLQNAWMESPTHRANILKPEYTEIGVSVATGRYEGRPVIFVATHFGQPQ